MAYGKVDFYGETLIDLTEDTINENVVFEGFTGHNAKGEPFTGKLSKDADTVDGYHIITTTDTNAVGQVGAITFIG